MGQGDKEALLEEIYQAVQEAGGALSSKSLKPGTDVNIETLSPKESENVLKRNLPPGSEAEQSKQRLEIFWIGFVILRMKRSGLSPIR